MKGYVSLWGVLCLLLGGCGASYSPEGSFASTGEYPFESSSSSSFKGGAINQVISHFENEGTLLEETSCYVFTSSSLSSSSGSEDAVDFLFSYCLLDNSFKISGTGEKSSSSGSDFYVGSVSFFWGGYESGMFFGDAEFADGSGVLLSYYSSVFAADHTIESAEYSPKKNTGSLEKTFLQEASISCLGCLNLAVVYVDHLLALADLPSLS
jgi:hypothetical protein